MYAYELIGKKAIRTKPVVLGKDAGMFGMGVQVITRHDYSHTTSPVLIVGATENHILYKSLDSFLDNTRVHILDCRWCDNNWIDYDELMELTSDDCVKFVQGINQKLAINPESEA